MILLVFGILITGAGVVAIALGVPAGDSGLGQTWIMTGAMGVVGGPMLIGVGAVVTQVSEVNDRVRTDRVPQVGGVGGGDDLVVVPHLRNHVQQLPLPDRVLVELQLVDHHDRAVHALGDKPDQQKQNVFLAAAQPLVGIFVLTVREENVELS